jgi:hypothetical protein
LTEERILAKLLTLNLERAAKEKNAGKTWKSGTTREKRGDELI